MNFLLKVVLLSCCTLACVCASEGDHHEEEEHPWEWSGLFHMDQGHYTWTATRKDGSYAESSMNVLLLAAEDHDHDHDRRLADTEDHDDETLEDHAREMWSNMTWTTATSGQELVPGVGYKLQFDSHSWISTFPVHVGTSGDIGIFAEHNPAEFEDNIHFLKAEDGTDIMPEESAAVLPDRHPDLAIVMLGSFITCTPTLLGVLFLACAWRPELRTCMEKISPSLDSFASGVLFAAAVFLLLPEGLHLAGAGQDESVGAAFWGTSILLGWLTCTLIHHTCSALFSQKEAAVEIKAVTNNTTVDVETGRPVVLLGKTEQETSASAKSIDKVDVKPNEEKKETGASAVIDHWMTLAGPVLFGDLFHNLTDGLVIGAAFRNCAGSFAWKLIAITVAHELPQEIADFFILINDAHMRWHWATLANFACSLSTVVGALFAYEQDIGSNEQGMILAYGAGVYMFVAMTELGTKVVNLKQTPTENIHVASAMLQRLIPFAVGCIAIGLILIDHEHCAVVSSTADPHAGHNH